MPPALSVTLDTVCFNRAAVAYLRHPQLVLGKLDGCLDQRHPLLRAVFFVSTGIIAVFLRAKRSRRVQNRIPSRRRSCRDPLRSPPRRIERGSYRSSGSPDLAGTATRIDSVHKECHSLGIRLRKEPPNLFSRGIHNGGDGSPP